MKPVPLERFSGLNLRDDPQEVGWNGAIDLLNADVDQRGRVRARDGYDNFTTVAGSLRYDTLLTYTGAGVDTPHLIAAASGLGSPSQVDALNVSGGVIASATAKATISRPYSLVAYGTPTATYVFCANGSDTVFRWNGAAFATPAYTGTTPTGRCLAVQPADNRLVVGNQGSTESRVLFSDPGDPLTFGADNYVDLTPGDGQVIQTLVSWREMLFAFKDRRFFVFYGNSTDSTGGAVFNYRPVDAKVGTPGINSACAAPGGVYFVTDDGVYVTTGGAPQRISGAISPLFDDDTHAYYLGDTINKAELRWASLCWHDDRLYVSVRTGASAYNNRLLVYEPATEAWTIWDVPASCVTEHTVANVPRLVFGYATGSNHVGVVSPSYTTDDGTAISWRYRTGFADLGTPMSEKIVRGWLLDGQGTVTAKVAVNDGSLDSGVSVALGAAPATGTGRRWTSSRGRNFSLELSGTTAAQVNRAVAMIRSERPPGLKSA